MQPWPDSTYTRLTSHHPSLDQQVNWPFSCLSTQLIPLALFVLCLPASPAMVSVVILVFLSQEFQDLLRVLPMVPALFSAPHTTNEGDLQL